MVNGESSIFNGSSIGGSGTLEFDASANVSVDFLSAAGGELSLGDPAAFTGSISDFSGHDVIDLLGQTITGLSYSGTSSSGTLTVTGAGGTIATLAFNGAYTTASFGFSGSMINLGTEWNGTGDWNTNTNDWSRGLPDLTTPAEIQSGACVIATSGQAQQLTVDYGATLQLDHGASLSVAYGLNALGATTLDGDNIATIDGDLTNFGTLSIAGGDTVTVGGDLTNYVALTLAGGDTMTISGNLTTYGAFTIGAATISASTAVTAANLVYSTEPSNSSQLVLQGDAASGGKAAATLDVAGAAPFTLTGNVRVSGNATLTFGSGSINYITPGETLEIDGAGAQILTDGGAGSPFSGTLTNSGSLIVRGGSAYGAGGATLKIGDFIDNGSVWIDGLQGDGGSTANFGDVAGIGKMFIGNATLSASTTVVDASTFVGGGRLVLQGNASSGTTNQASLVVYGPAPPAIGPGEQEEDIQVSGDAALQFGSGQIIEVYNGALEIDGAGAQILTDNGARSALSGLTSNFGYLALRGDSSLGAGGATLTTAGGLANTGTINVDAVNGDGGSTLTVGGELSSQDTINIGNSALSATTTVAAASLDNVGGTISLLGVGSGSHAELVVNGAATSSGNIDIGAGAEVDVTGSNSFTQSGFGATTDVTGSLVASTINANGGLIDFHTAVTGGDGVGALNIGAQGTLEFHAAVDKTHSVNFAASSGTLTFTDPRSFAGTIDNFAGNDEIHLLNKAVTALSYSGTGSSGTLTLTGSSGTIASLAFNGDYSTPDFSFQSDGRGGTEIFHI
jgi:hypothetical protein